MFNRCWCLLIVIKTMSSFILFYRLYFHVNGVDFFHMIIFDLINFLFRYCLRFEFSLFNFAIYSVFGTHIFNPLFKRCGKFRNICIVFNEFLWKHVSSITVVSSERSSVSGLIGIIPIPIFFHSSCCFTLKSFSSLCCFSNIWSYQ